jgi:hypothetical protein
MCVTGDTGVLCLHTINIKAGLPFILSFLALRKRRLCLAMHSVSDCIRLFQFVSVCFSLYPSGLVFIRLV